MKASSCISLPSRECSNHSLSKLWTSSPGPSSPTPTSLLTRRRWGSAATAVCPISSARLSKRGLACITCVFDRPPCPQAESADSRQVFGHLAPLRDLSLHHPGHYDQLVDVPKFCGNSACSTVWCGTRAPHQLDTLFHFFLRHWHINDLFVHTPELHLPDVPGPQRGLNLRGPVVAAPQADRQPCRRKEFCGISACLVTWLIGVLGHLVDRRGQRLILDQVLGVSTIGVLATVPLRRAHDPLWTSNTGAPKPSGTSSQRANSAARNDNAFFQARRHHRQCNTIQHTCQRDLQTRLIPDVAALAHRPSVYAPRCASGVVCNSGISTILCALRDVLLGLGPWRDPGLLSDTMRRRPLVERPALRPGGPPRSGTRARPRSARRLVPVVRFAPSEKRPGADPALPTTPTPSHLPSGKGVNNTGCFFGIGALVFEKVLSCETRGPILRNRGPIQRNTVSLNRTAHE